MTFYLKYRPKNINELDLGDVKEQLLKIVNKGEDVPHAFLFAGPRGAGKTSAARILAKAVNCENPRESGEPCNECSQCNQISKGISLDIIELDAASNRGVEDIRSLKDSVALSSSGARKKIYIIDEAHMLTTDASNALLKTLEEPPAHVIFVLATTASEKLLDTIKSRCLTIIFRKAAKEELIKSLKKVIAGEKLELEEGVLEEIVKRVDGSFREAHTILEQLSLNKKKLTLEDIKKSQNYSTNTVLEFINFLATKETKSALAMLLKANDNGVNIKNFSTEVVAKLREELLKKLGVIKGEQYVNLTIEELQMLTSIFTDACSKIANSVIPSLPVELAVVKWGQKNNDQEQTASSEQAPQGILEKTESKPPESLEKLKLEPSPAQLTKTNDYAKKPEKDESKVETLPKSVSMAKIIDFSGKILEEKWKEIITSIKPKNFSIEALLRAARPAGFDGKNLQIEVFYQFHKERLEKDQYKKIIENAACEILEAQNIRLVCLLSATPKKALDFVNITDVHDENILEVAEKIFTEETSQSESLPN